MRTMQQWIFCSFFGAVLSYVVLQVVLSLHSNVHCTEKSSFYFLECRTSLNNSITGEHSEWWSSSYCSRMFIIISRKDRSFSLYSADLYLYLDVSINFDVKMTKHPHRFVLRCISNIKRLIDFILWLQQSNETKK